MDTNTHRILVLEDDEELGEMLLNVIATRGFDYMWTPTVTEFQERFPAFRPNICLVDLQLPDGSGFDVLTGMDMANTKVILMSGFDVRVLNHVAEYCRNQNIEIIGVLNKPFDIRKVEEILDEFQANGDRFITPERIAEALNNDEIEVHYQPVYDLKNPDSLIPVEIEALVRWRRTDGTLFHASDFVRVIRNHLVKKSLMLHVARRVATDMEGLWRTNPTLRVSINMPPRLIRDTAFARTFANALGLAPGKIKPILLEIDETGLETIDEELKTNIVMLRLLGAGFTLDNFGRGSNAMKTLYDLPWECIKVATELQREVTNRAQGDRLMSSILSFAQALNMRTCAKGVENGAQASLVQSLGFDLAQGFFYTRPMELDRIKALLYG